MKRFRFSLQSVATLRSMQELRARENLATALRAIEEASLACAKARTQREELEQMLRAGDTALIRAGERVAALGALGRAGLAESAAQTALTAATVQRERRVAEYHTAARHRKALTTLEGKARERHRLAQEREEQNALDERASIAAARAAGTLS